MIGPPLPYNVHTNVHAVFHGIPAPPLDLLRFPPFPSSKDFKNFPDLEDRCVKFIALCVPSPPTKRGKLETCRASLDSYRTDVFFLSFFLSFFLFSLSRFQQTRLSRYESTRCYEPSLHRGFKEVFAAVSSDLILVQGTDSGEENNPATVRWIDTTRTYVDM